MDIDDTPAEAALRAEVRAWLDTVAVRRSETDGMRGLRAKTDEDDAAQLAAAKRWQRTKFDAGWAAPHWPVAHGGQGRTALEAGVVAEEERRYAVPGPFFMIGIDMVGPTLLAHGSDAQRARFLEPLLRGDEVWCQLFTEPGAGSDLAALATRAVPAPDGGWLLTGQKVWTSSAHVADWGICLARTDPCAPKHAGITYFLVDMRAPGVTVRPLRQIDGAIHFNEVFLDSVAVPDEHVVGEVGGGWAVAMTTLTAERTAIGGGGPIGWREVAAVAAASGVEHDPVVRQAIARVATRELIQRWIVYRVRTALVHGRPPGPEATVLKLLNSHQVEAVGAALVDVLGARGMLWHDDAPDDGRWQDVFLSQWASRIGGGTEQVQRTIIAERVLGLPREPDASKGVPWNELPRA